MHYRLLIILGVYFFVSNGILLARTWVFISEGRKNVEDLEGLVTAHFGHFFPDFGSINKIMVAMGPSRKMSSSQPMPLLFLLFAMVGLMKQQMSPIAIVRMAGKM